MAFWRSKPTSPKPDFVPTGPVWGPDVLKRIAERKRLTVRVTHLQVDTIIGGRALEPTPQDDPNVEATGWLGVYGQFIHATLGFGRGHDKANNHVSLSWSRVDRDFRQQLAIPVASVYLTGNAGLKQALVAAHRDAVSSGRHYCELGLFKEQQREEWVAEATVTGRASFDVDTVIVWSEIHAPGLAPWGYPLSHERSNFDGYPSPDQLRTAPPDNGG